MDSLCHILTPVGMMGYGFDEKLTSAALSSLVATGIPTAIILDAGSTDSGPSKLALGTMTCPRSAYSMDLEKLLRLVHSFKVPLIFASAGGSGSDEHVNTMLEIIREITAEASNHIDKSVVLERLRADHITPCGACVPPLKAEDVEASARILAQMGPEPLLDAMEATPDFNILIGGRAYDPAPYVAYATFQLKRRFPDTSYQAIQERNGGLTHMGKIMECGGLCATPKSAGAITTIYANGVFDVSPIDPTARCTPYSVAAHALYENSRPDILQGPGGSLHLDGSTYEQLQGNRTVRVRGSVFRSSQVEDKPYRFKLEGARVVGYRSLFMGSIKDPILISQIDQLLLRAKQYVNQQHSENSGQWDLGFHVYGKDSTQVAPSCGIFLVAEALAQTQQLASSVASKARIGIIHGAYPGQKATAGNFGFGIGGLTEIEAGPCTEFSVYHLMDLLPGEERLLKGNSSSQLTGHDLGLIRQSITTVGRLEADAEGNSSISAAQFIQHDKSSNKVNTVQNASEPLTKNQVAKDEVIEHKTLGSLASVLRSKNAGPYEITIDVIFNSASVYQLIKSAGFLNPDAVAAALGIQKEDIVWAGFFDPAQAFKMTVPRVRGGKRTASGGFLEDDLHGSQQHTGIFNMALPEELRQALSNLQVPQ